MKLRELVNGMAADTDFFICAGNTEIDGRQLCQLEGTVFRNFSDFDWLLDKQIEAMEVDRDYGAIKVTINLIERGTTHGEEGKEL